MVFDKSVFSTFSYPFAFHKDSLVSFLSALSLLILGSFLSVAWHPVPVTFQPEAALLIALFYNKSIAQKVFLTYITAGAIGLPVFANGMAGIPVLFGITGGYLLGMFMAITLIGTLKNSFIKFFKSKALAFILLVIMGNAIIFSFGVVGLTNFASTLYAINIGFTSFLLPTILKSLVIGVAYYRYVKSFT